MLVYQRVPAMTANATALAASWALRSLIMQLSQLSGTQFGAPGSIRVRTAGSKLWSWILQVLLDID